MALFNQCESTVLKEKLNKIINATSAYVDESLGGMLAAYPAIYRLSNDSKRVVVRAKPKQFGKVGIASGGGFGHLPLFAGYVGLGLLDSCAVGEVFAGPPLVDVQTAIRSAERGSGVLRLIGNYGGDRMSFELAGELLSEEGIQTQTVIVNDDVASADINLASKRRGVAGLLFAYKVAGAAAEKGYSLAEVSAVTQKAVNQCRSIGVALAPCVVPTAGKPTFELEPGTMEMGMGIHGERGIRRCQLQTANEIVDEMLERVLVELDLPAGSTVAIICNSLGATPLEELFIAFKRVSYVLAKKHLKIGFSMIGHLVTSMEMSGISLTAMVLDDQLATLIDAPVQCPFWRIQ